MRTVLITLIGPERSADLVVDADTELRELLPSLMSAGGVPAGEPGSDWGVAVMGRQPIAREETLDAAGVLDGAVLVLRRESPERAGAFARAVPAAGPAGSPRKRTRDLLAGHGAATPRRTRLLAALPETGLASDGARGELEHAVAAPQLVRCATIAVVSPKGGIGKTTLTVLLGELIASLREDTVVVALDADSDYGSLGRVPPPRRESTETSADAVFDSLAQGSVTFAELDRTLWKLPGGLRIVPSPRNPAAMARADRETYARVLGNLQRLAGVLVIDCGTGLGQPGVQAAVLACDQLVLITDVSAPTASLAVEAIGLLERAGRPITVVGNRVRRGRQGQEDLERLDVLFPRAAGLVGVPDEPEAERALRGAFRWEEASRTLRQGVLELAAVLALGWGGTGASQTSFE